MTYLLFVVCSALIYRLRGGGFAVNDWRPGFLHSRYIAFLLQSLLFIAIIRGFTTRPWWHGLLAGVLWLLAVSFAWGAWFDLGTFLGPQKTDPGVAWIHAVLDLLFGPLPKERILADEVARDAVGMALRGIFFIPLLAFILRPFSWKCLAILASIWIPLYPACYALHHHLWPTGPNPELYVGLLLGLLTFPSLPGGRGQVAGVSDPAT